MRIINERVSVRVPASALLFGSEFSGIGISLDLWDEVSATLTTGTSKAVLLGNGSTELPKDRHHPIIAAMLQILERLGQPTAGIELVCRNNIPRGIGLGNREADLLAALLLVKALMGDPEDFDATVLQRLAADFPFDTVRFASAMHGGARLAWKPAVQNSLNTVALSLHQELQMTLILPSIAERKAEAEILAVRKEDTRLIPESMSGLLVYALEHNPKLIRHIARTASDSANREKNNFDGAPEQKYFSRTREILNALQKAGWPALGIVHGAGIIVFAHLQELLQADLISAGFDVFPIDSASCLFS